jgi:pimeloyl-ACP methyl ester carboxylesterase
MRRPSFAAIAAVVSLGLAACTSSAGSIPPAGGIVPSVPPARGTILSMARVGTITKADMTAGLAGQVITELGGAPLCDVTLYAIKYQTIGIHGESADASEGFFVPNKGCKAPFPLVGYAQGTNVVKAQKITAPTKRNIEPTVVAAIYAAHGDAVAATDYLGLGYSSYPYQPYLVIDSEAAAVIDSMRASRTAAKMLHVSLSPAVLLTGHSQGGQSAMATQREIQASEPGEFHLIADAPSSGPYDLSQTLVDGVLHPGQNAPVLATYALTAYQHVYGNVYAQSTDAFKQPYATGIDTLLPVLTYAQASDLLGKTLPLNLHALMQPAFEKSFVGDPKSGGRIDAALNDLLVDWTPAAPLALCGGSKDPQVEYKNSELAYAFFKKRGAAVTLTDVNPYMPSTVPKSEYHDAVLVLCLTLNRVAILDPIHTLGIPRYLKGRGPSRALDFQPSEIRER